MGQAHSRPVEETSLWSASVTQTVLGKKVVAQILKI